MMRLHHVVVESDKCGWIPFPFVSCSSSVFFFFLRVDISPPQRTPAAVSLRNPGRAMLSQNRQGILAQSRQLLPGITGAAAEPATRSDPIRLRSESWTSWTLAFFYWLGKLGLEAVGNLGDLKGLVFRGVLGVLDAREAWVGKRAHPAQLIASHLMVLIVSEQIHS